MMLGLVIAYLGGVLTIASPCILPILPLVFSRSGQPFSQSGLPMLAGMVLTFTGFATLAAVGGEWTVFANEYGRYLALIFMGLFSLALIFPQFSVWSTSLLVSTGNRLTNYQMTNQPQGRKGALLTGVATGLLWAPCAGPILGLVLTSAIIKGANAGSTLLLFSYAAGAATSLALALCAGNKVFMMMKNSAKYVDRFRRVFGVMMLSGVVAISLGWDRSVLAQVSLLSTDKLETKLLDTLGPPSVNPVIDKGSAISTVGSANAIHTVADVTPLLQNRGLMPPLNGAVEWLNSKPLTAQALRGKVVLVHFWTFACINCQRSLPYVNEWARKYRDQGLVVIGVHSPEFAFEKSVKNVKREAAKLGIDYPIAIDNNFKIWRAYNNNYWPAHYFIDAKGQIRYMHIGEGDYEQSEQVIQALLRESSL